MNKTFDYYFLNLSVNAPVEKYEEAVLELSKRNDYDLRKLILPIRYKEFDDKGMYWKEYSRGCAIIICNKSDEEIISLFPDLFIWFQDINWPGGIELLRKLNKFPKEALEIHRQKAIQKAKEENDDTWIEYLNWIDYKTDY